MTKKVTGSTAAFERAAKAAGTNQYVLRLYVTGTTVRSARAIANVRKICEQHLKGRYRLEVIDLYQQPHLAESEQIIAAPTLVKELPSPVRRVLGDMSKSERVLVVLGLKPKPSTEAPVAK
jgi:circadian clock protein KaiB